MFYDEYETSHEHQIYYLQNFFQKYMYNYLLTNCIWILSLTLQHDQFYLLIIIYLSITSIGQYVGVVLGLAGLGMIAAAAVQHAR